MELVIKWQIGEPKESGSYLVTVKGLYDTFVTCSYYSCLNGWSHWKEEEIIAWCKLGEIKSYKEETMEEEGILTIDFTKDTRIADKVEVILGDYEFVLEDGKTYFVKKHPQYPKTYEELNSEKKELMPMLERKEV